jgi:hypothetical protein
MSTLGTLKSEIADDLKRSDLDTAIASEIGYAIEFYQKEQLFFKETHTAAFNTVADQVYYSSSDDADIGLIVTLDSVQIRISTNDYELIRLPIETFEILNDAQTSSGQPTNYVYHDKQIGIYIPPDDAYTITLIGTFQPAAPATDGETDNVWMTDGYKLIRAHTVSQLSRFKTRENDYADRMEREASRQLDDLRVMTARQKATGCIASRSF